MSKKALVAGAVLAASTLGASVAQAEVTANIGVASSYLFRGDVFGDDAAVSGGIDWSHGSVYAGTWLSSQGGGGAGEEVDVYFGFAPGIFDLGYIYYQFQPHDMGAGDAHEVYFGVNPGSGSIYVWAGGVFAAPDDEYVYLEANYNVGLTENTSLDFHAGLFHGFGDAYDTASNDSVTNYDLSTTLNIDDFFATVSYKENERATSDTEEFQYLVGWSKEFMVKK